MLPNWLLTGRAHRVGVSRSSSSMPRISSRICRHGEGHPQRMCASGKTAESAAATDACCVTRCCHSPAPVDAAPRKQKSTQPQAPMAGLTHLLVVLAVPWRHLAVSPQGVLQVAVQLVDQALLVGHGWRAGGPSGSGPGRPPSAGGAINARTAAPGRWAGARWRRRRWLLGHRRLRAP